MTTTRTYDGKPIRWADKSGAMHAAEGDWLTREDFCLWTVCGSHDVPANTGFTAGDGDVVTCPHCRDKLASENVQ